jgi:putative peptidoglycan lipid II flippase
MSLARKIAAVGGATLTSRLLGFARDAGVAALLGAGAQSDAYFAATQIPNLARRLLAEGALNGAFIPVWLRLRQSEGDRGTDRFAGNVLGVVTVMATSAALFIVVFAPAIIDLLAPGFGDAGDRRGLAIEFLRWASPYLACAGIAAVAAAILNGESRIKMASYGLLIFNVVLVGAVGLAAVLGLAETASAGRMLSASIVIAGLAQAAIVMAAIVRMRGRLPRVSFRLSPDVRMLLMRAGPGLIAAGIPQLTLIVCAFVASTSPAAVSWLYYANRLYELPLGVVALAISSVLVPLIATAAHSRDAARIAQAQSLGLEFTVGLALPAAAAFIVMAHPIAVGVFERGAFGAADSGRVATTLAIMAVGLPAHALEKFFAAVSFAHDDTRTPMATALAGLAVAIVAAIILFPAFGLEGAAVAIAAGAWTGAGLIGLTLRRRRWLLVTADSLRRLSRIGLAAAAMALAVGLAASTAAPIFTAPHGALVRLAVLSGLVAGGLATYFAALRLLGATGALVLARGARKPR